MMNEERTGQMDLKIWIAGIWGEPTLKTVAGLERESDVTVIKDDFALRTEIQNMYHVIRTKFRNHGKRLAEALLEMPVLDRYYVLSHCNFEENKQNYIIIFNSALTEYYSRGYFRRLKRKHANVKLILYIIDPMPNGMVPRLKKMQDVFDRILTIQTYNTERYGIEFLQHVYTPICCDLPAGKAENMGGGGIYYCGVVDQFRYDILVQILRRCQKENIRYEMYFFKGERFPIIEDSNIHYELLPYDENVEKANRSNCILEIVREGFVGFTYRYYEAVVYNKKLLTNNADIRRMKYYDARYMQYFERIEDIDWEWVKDSADVNYHYQDDFSPEKWKENIIKIVDGI